MSLHLRITGSKSFCGKPGLVGLTLKFAVHHPEWTVYLMNVFGCQSCMENFQEAIENMRRDNVELVWPK